MAATDGSIYQALRLQHIAGNPPNTDPQRLSETFAAYQTRMARAYLNPDIDPDESDADYLDRLASYLPAVPFSNVTASYALNALNADFAISSSHSDGV